MADINTAGVVRGGLAAGLVMTISETILNVPVLGPQMEAEFAAHNIPTVAGGAIAVFAVICFIVGLLTVWPYAAVRPRLGPGPKTAITIGIVVWALGYAWCGSGYGVIGITPWNIVTIAMAWSFVEMILALLVGAYLYSEA